MNEDKSTRYQRLQRRVSVATWTWSLILLVGLAWSGTAVSLRDAITALPGGDHRAAAVSYFVLAVALLHEAGVFLFGSYSYMLERRYGLTHQPSPRWVLDQGKSLALTLLVAAVAVNVVYWAIARTGEWWWLVAGILFVLFVAVTASLAPILVLPLFYRIRPLARDELRLRLLALAERAGASVLGAYEWGLGDSHRKANAALTGLGSTRRILVSDTMLADYSDDEIEVVLAHELAHHVHGDLWKGLALQCLFTLAGLFVAAQVLDRVGPMAGLTGPGDIAGLPLLLLSVAGVGLVMVPAAHAMSRSHERRADRFALELTRNPHAFISVMRRLGQQHLAEHEPSRMVSWLFHSHPSLGERIAVANAYRPTGTSGASNRVSRLGRATPLVD